MIAATEVRRRPNALSRLQSPPGLLALRRRRSRAASQRVSTLSSVAVKRRWRFYTTAAGRSPVRDFLTAARLSSDDRDEILAAMKDVQVNGLPIARHLSGDVYEVRADGRQATYRVLFAAEGKSSQVLLALSAFSKKTQRTPPDEIRLAHRRLTDWRARARTE
ncbi:MAG TPA: type II toxin-antitoxin system RelE/ParE family toxin [Acidimicrobiia bacterium]|nr:type II toxin-antitoxin system RelE/ParE family toxin [Acidimicrobiia bacterium]